jgi:hypothetical protein
MEESAARELMQEIVALTAQLNVVMHKVEEVISGAELPVMRRHVAMMAAAADEHLFRPILRQYPDLDPHKENIRTHD